MKINQCYLSTTVKHGGKFVNFPQKYGCTKYKTKDKPAFFFGLYTAEDLKVLKNHRSMAVVIWRGGDATREKNIKLSSSRHNIKHIAISSFIADDLKSTGINYKFLPIVGSNIKKMKATPLGKCIYAYVPKNHRKFYGGDIIDKLKKRSNYKIIVSSSSSRYSKKKMLNIYDNCFCGLRLTEHDGIANTVIELGLKGRKCIYNGCTPNAICWNKKDIDSILLRIDEEAKKIGSTNTELAKQVAKYIDIGEEWLDTKYWK